MLTGFRVMVVEDEVLVAEDLTQAITEAEGVVLGPFPVLGKHGRS